MGIPGVQTTAYVPARLPKWRFLGMQASDQDQCYQMQLAEASSLDLCIHRYLRLRFLHGSQH